MADVVLGDEADEGRSAAVIAFEPKGRQRTPLLGGCVVVGGSRLERGAMRRRQLITLLGGAAIAWPFVTSAQQSDRMRRIGLLMSAVESDREGQTHVAAFREGLQKVGWAEGRNIRIEARWTAPRMICRTWQASGRLPAT